MSDTKSTKLSIREDRPTAITSALHGANFDALGFNVNFLAIRKPHIAIALLKLYAEASKVQETDPKAPDEDFELFTKVLRVHMTELANEE